MYLKSIELNGFKSFGKKTEMVFTSPIASIVGPNGSGKSNVAEAFRFVLGEQSMKSMRSKRGEDLIWGGTPVLARSNRAAVKVVLDNSKRLLDLDFKEVVLERVVYRDGQNEYLLNGTQVRLKDVIRLLAGANIGGSGYQIISQGEADRILNASPRERREMVEDALGLKLYQHKKAESERKLDETAANIDKTRSLRREIAPHLHFLRVQVEKIEKARELKEELAVRLTDYLAREHAWITQEDARLLNEIRAHESTARALQDKLTTLKQTKSDGEREQIEHYSARLRELESKLSALRTRRGEVTRELGRAEGALHASTSSIEQAVSVASVRHFTHELGEQIAEIEKIDELSLVRGRLHHVRESIRSFVQGLSGTVPESNKEAHTHVEQLTHTLRSIEQEEHAYISEVDQVRSELARVREQKHEAERESMLIDGQLREARVTVGTIHEARSALSIARQKFEDEVREGIALIGAAVHDWQKDTIPEGALSEPRSAQDKRRREIERLKIKIEESGVGNGDAVIREFKHTKERDEFLGREMADLEASATSLRSIIADLDKTIDQRFTEGLTHINAALRVFFSKLFNGGEAKLEIEESRRTRTDDDGDSNADIEDLEDLYTGLTISVSLPRKKVRGLEVLSGGERALTSIALIFSMSQVNPPPFLILDETDAALDEANSRRYAEMIRELGHRSQLIVITHNRATMAAAGELYGVTMGADGVSKLLSVKLEEAARVAK